MDKDNEKEINALFRRVATMPTIEAFAFLGQLDADPAVVQQVAALLSDEQTRTVFLENNPDLQAIFTPLDDREDLSGARIGDIQLIRQLGRGGMGAVYLGEDTQLERKVAVKTIRGKHRLSPVIKDRLRREALVLSKIDHPAVCRIHNIIESGDVHFLVLEYVPGVTLNKYLEGDVGRRQKLDIARTLLDALASAHQRGIVHRDLKPDNIMVSDAQQVKVLDFGISRSMGREELSPDAARTHTSAHTSGTHSVSETLPGSIIGTLGYMCPEQARGEEITPASDIYSLGLVLQEMFSGARAHPTDQQADELLQRARDGVSEQVLGVSRDLARLIQRMKSASPTDRPTAVDARAMLDAIVAKPKKRLRNAALALIAVIAVAGFSKYTVDLKREQAFAEQARDDAEQVTAFLASLFSQSDPYLDGGERTARDMLEDGAQRIDNELAEQPRARAVLKLEIGNVYRQLAMYPQADAQLQQAEHILSRDGLDDSRLMAQLLLTRSTLEMEKGDYEQAAETLKKMLTWADKSPQDRDKLLFDGYSQLGTLQSKRGQFQAANTTFQQAMTLVDNPGINSKAKVELHNSLALMHWRQDQLPQAEAAMKKAIALSEAMDQVRHSRIISSLISNLSLIQVDEEKFPEAIANAEKVLAMRAQHLSENHPELALAYDNLAVAHYRAGDKDTAGELNKQALDIYEKALGRDHPDFAMALANRATFLFRTGRPLEGETALREVIDIFIAAHGQDHYNVAFYKANLGKLLRHLERNDEAIEQMREAVAIYRRNDMPLTGDYFENRRELALMLANTGQPEAGREALQSLLSDLQSADDPSEEMIQQISEDLEKIDAP